MTGSRRFDHGVDITRNTNLLQVCCQQTNVDGQRFLARCSANKALVRLRNRLFNRLEELGSSVPITTTNRGSPPLASVVGPWWCHVSTAFVNQLPHLFHAFLRRLGLLAHGLAWKRVVNLISHTMATLFFFGVECKPPILCDFGILSSLSEPCARVDGGCSPSSLIRFTALLDVSS